MRLSEHARELRRLGESRFAERYGCPALIGIDTQADERAEFHTDVQTNGRTPGGTSTLASAIDVGSSDVLWVRKRGGAPFPDRIGVGRVRTADVRLALTKVSKYHAFFSVDEEGGWCITDAGSVNGTWLDSKRLAARRAMRLWDGARVGFGPHELTFFEFATVVGLLRTL